MQHLQLANDSGNSDMNQDKTASILQRIPVIVGVTAASYGLTHAQAAQARNPASNTASPVAPRTAKQPDASPR
jgi:hypothetical protein